MLTKPFGKGLFYPGPGVGEYCIAVDQEWLKSVSEKTGHMPEMINLARTLNNGMPEYTVSILQDLLTDCGYPIRFRSSYRWQKLFMHSIGRELASSISWNRSQGCCRKQKIM
jgi:hypothetical protein